MSEYNSSEELQRHKADVFSRESDAKPEASTTEKDKVKKVLDDYIKKHQTTKGVREELKKKGKAISGKALELQFEVSDSVVEILEKIKSDLR